MTTEEIKALLIQFIYWIAEKPDMLEYAEVSHAADHFMQEDPFRMYPSVGAVFAIQEDPEDMEMTTDYDNVTQQEWDEYEESSKYPYGE